MARPLHEIATEIYIKWVDKNGASKVHPWAAPYLSAMASLNSVSDNYGQDSGKDMVLYFLNNARSFTGPDAKRIKLELKALAGIK